MIEYLLLCSPGIILLLLALYFQRRAIKTKKLYEAHPDLAKKYLEKLQKRELQQNKITQIAFIIAGIILILTGVGIAIYQGYYFLKHGVWQEHSVLSFIDNSENNIANKLKNPSDWFGLSKIVYNTLNFLPLSATFIVIGFLLINFANSDDNK